MSAPASKATIASATAVVALAIAAASCGSSHQTSAAQTIAPNPAAAWHQVVLCARAHGMPNLPEPRIDANGQPTFPSGLVIRKETRRSCQALVNRLVPEADNQAPTPARLAALLGFARCMRSHGIPDWPDPRPDGSFVPDARIARSLKSAFRSQLMACDRFNPDPHGRVYFSHP